MQDDRPFLQIKMQEVNHLTEPYHLLHFINISHFYGLFFGMDIGIENASIISSLTKFVPLTAINVFTDVRSGD